MSKTATDLFRQINSPLGNLGEHYSSEQQMRLKNGVISPTHRPDLEADELTDWAWALAGTWGVVGDYLLTDGELELPSAAAHSAV